MCHKVKAVLFGIEAGLAAVAVQGVFAKRFFRFLCPLHNPPQNIVYMRMVRLLELAFFREYRRLIDDNVLWLGSFFASTNSDFYSNSERRESYGCIVATMASHQYSFKDGRKLFVSKKTLNEGASSLLACPLGVLEQLETVNSFKKFDQSHTGEAIGEWMVAEHAAKGLLPNYVVYHCTDGASNAVASVTEYELLTAVNREAPISHQKCLAHQTNRSAKYASGTGDFKNNANPRLSDILHKAHTIIARVHRSSARLKIVKDIQMTANRKSVVIPSPGVTTRWDSANKEVASLNRIMGDFSKALHNMIQGMDNHKLKGKDGLLPVTDFTFTPSDKLILRQFECGSEPCVLLSKFYQINDATSHETIFVTTAYLMMMRMTYFLMYDDISHSDLADLKARKKTVYVVSSVHPEDDESGRKEECMDPCIELFRLLYAEDMEVRCGLTESPGSPAIKLPTMTAIALLLNPLYGGRGRITLNGLMTEEQYDHAEEDLIGRMQLMMERDGAEPVVLSDNSADSEDDEIVLNYSSERDKARLEFHRYCKVVKRKKCRPQSYVGNTLDVGAIRMGKVATRGEDIKALTHIVTCNLADFVDDDGRFDLVSFLKLQCKAFPTLYKLAVCLASIRTNEVGCERFFSTAGYVSCPRRTSLKVRNYECLATLKANIRNVFIDEEWVVNKYMMMESKKSWADLDSPDDLKVLNLERELFAESLGVGLDSLPAFDEEDPIVEAVVIDLASE